MNKLRRNQAVHSSLLEMVAMATARMCFDEVFFEDGNLFKDTKMEEEVCEIR